MAAIITHIVLADKIHKKYFNTVKEKDYIIGTSFPDIRHLGDIKQEQTHQQITSLKDTIKNKPTDFELGIAVHSLVDHIRDGYVKTQQVRELVESETFRISLKFYEDSVLYSKLTAWDKIFLFFSELTEEEKKYGIPEEELLRWHKLILEYISTNPSQESQQVFMMGIGFTTERIEKIIKEVSILKKLNNPYINGLYEDLESWLNKF